MTVREEQHDYRLTRMPMLRRMCFIVANKMLKYFIAHKRSVILIPNWKKNGCPLLNEEVDANALGVTDHQPSPVKRGKTQRRSSPIRNVELDPLLRRFNA